jgi:hypothetical protein
LHLDPERTETYNDLGVALNRPGRRAGVIAMDEHVLH